MGMNYQLRCTTVRCPSNRRVCTFTNFLYAPIDYAGSPVLLFNVDSYLCYRAFSVDFYV